MSTFVDRAVVHAQGGNGGNGCASVHREKFKPLGGPDGGNGGRGGDVIAVVDSSVTTLLDLHRHPHRRARHGKPGQGSHRNGADADDVIVGVRTVAMRPLSGLAVRGTTVRVPVQVEQCRPRRVDAGA